MKSKWFLSPFLLTTACAGLFGASSKMEQAKAQVQACDDRSKAFDSASASDATPASQDVSGKWSCSVEGSTTEYWRVAQSGGDITVMGTNGQESWSMLGKVSGATLRLPKNGVELQIAGDMMSGKVFGIYEGACRDRALVCSR